MLKEEKELAQALKDKRKTLQIFDTSAKKDLIKLASDFSDPFTQKKQTYDRKIGHVLKTETNERRYAFFFSSPKSMKALPILVKNKIGIENKIEDLSVSSEEDGDFQMKKLFKNIRKIYASLNQTILPDTNLIDILKNLEVKFEQLLIENRGIKTAFPEFFSRTTKEYAFSQKKQPRELKEYLKTIEKNERRQQQSVRMKITLEMKLTRTPMKKYIIKSKKKITDGNDLNRSQLEDDKYFSEDFLYFVFLQKKS
jgi:hypothetical protein